MSARGSRIEHGYRQHAPAMAGVDSEIAAGGAQNCRLWQGLAEGLGIGRGSRLAWPAGPACLVLPR
jgi:hypothetical protein